MDDWGEDGDSDFAVDLNSENSAGNSDLSFSELPITKRHNAGSTPERFRAPAGAPLVQAAAAGESGGGGTAAEPQQQQREQPLQQQKSCHKLAGSSGEGSTQHQASGWTVRSIFMAQRPTAPPPPLRQPASAGAPPLPPPRSPLLSHGWGGTFTLAGGGIDEDEELPGPLTQMAAAGNASVASAFCPHCGCFLADLGGPQQQAAHAAACASRHGCRFASGVPASAQQQQQQLARAAGLSGSGVHGGRGGDEEEDEGDEQEQDGNCSEQEEASQAECGVATAAMAEDEAEGEDAAGSGQEDGPWAAGEGEVEEHQLPEGEEDGQAGGPAAAKAPAGAMAEEHSALRAWLERRGLAKYADHFARAGASLALLPCLSDADLQQMGIVALGARKKILLAAAELTEETAGTASTADAAGCSGVERAAADERWEEEGEQAAAGLQERRQSHAGAGPSGVGDWRALVAGSGGAVLSCNILQYFKPQGGGSTKKQAAPAGAAAAAAANPGCILSYLKAPDGSSLPVPPAKQAAAAGTGRGRGRGKQPAAQQWAHKAVAAAGGGAGGGKRWGPRAAQVLPMRQWQLVPGTAFVVDRFCNLPPQSPYRHWFLTHFHADHYKGLNGKFDRGTLYCSPPTARLVEQQLRVKRGCIREVPLNSPVTVEGVGVTFLEANHCPGAVMILFEPPGRRAVLHTGDCRLISDMQQETSLVAVRGRAELILDTTYCSPEYAFPSQQEVLRFAIDAVKAEAFNPNTLFLFGSYTIGKERLFLEAARVLQRKIYVSVAKRKILDCLDLPEEYRTLLTTDDQETNLHAVPLWMVSQKHMAKLLKHYRGRFTNAVGFQPTGWAHQRDANQTRARGRRRQKGTIITYQVPYSEHSSFSELRAFVDWFRPTAIIPSVNSDGGGPKAQALVRLLRGSGSSS